MSARPASRFLSANECQTLWKRASALAVGGGETAVYVESVWLGNLRWVRNQVSTSGDVRDNHVHVVRSVRSAAGRVGVNQIDGPALEAAVRRAERLLNMEREGYDTGLTPPKKLRNMVAPPEAHARPDIWSETTYQLDADHRETVMRDAVQSAAKLGMRAAGYIEVSATGRSVIRSTGELMYYPYTSAQYSVTVRDPGGTGSGWAGVDWHDWKKIDVAGLSAIALEKCVRSRNPVAIEPGRYTTILEPQAVCDLTSMLFTNGALWRDDAEGGSPTVYGTGRYRSRLGDRIIDERISVTTDCMDLELGFPPFSADGEIFHPVTWIDRGVLRNLAYSRAYAIAQLGKTVSQYASGAFRMSGGTASVDDMIATTKRGVLVTRFTGFNLVDEVSMLVTGYTRDGLWLVENGKISKAVKNFRFTESPMFVLNQVEQLGVPQRVFHPGAPVIVPALKVRDFSFTSLADAV